MKRHLLWAVLALAALAIVLLPGPAAAQQSNGARDQGNWTARSVFELIAAIDAANLAGGSHTINLAPGKTFTLTAVDNTTDGPTGLPVITPNNNLTIRGNGATIARSTAPGTPAFRLFDVATGAALTLENLTIANGQVIGDPGMDACGGAILNAAGASLTVKNAALVGNHVVGSDGGGGLGGFGYGGAIWNNGTASLEYVLFRGNQARGGATTNPDGLGQGGLALGGAISSQDLGSLIVRNCWFTANKAIGGVRHQPTWMVDGIGGSGAIDNWGTTLIAGSTFTDNQAIGGTADEGVDGGMSVGGAIGSGGPSAPNPVCTIQHCTFIRNQAVGSDAGSPDNVDGSGIGGALSTGFSQNDATMTITDCSFIANQALRGNVGFAGAGEGGAINQESPLVIGAKSTLTIANSIFTDNKAAGGGAGGAAIGGAIINSDWNADDGSGASLAISDSTFAGNQALGASGGDGSYASPGCAQSGAVDTTGNTIILNSTFRDNRAIGGTLLPGAIPSFDTASSGGGLSSWGGTLEVRDSSFVGNQVVGGAGSAGSDGSVAMGGGITVFSGLTATIANCSLFHNRVVGGAGGDGVSGGAGVGGGLNVGFYPYGIVVGPNSTVTVTGTAISHNQAIGGSGGGEGVGGGYAVGAGVLFGIPDTSSVTLNGGSRIEQNKPDDAFHF